MRNLGRYLTLAAAGLGGCLAQAEERGPAEQVLVVRANEFRFDAVDSVRAGRVRVRLQNDGMMPHHLQLLRLEPGHGAAEVLARAERGELVIPEARFMGGPAIPPVGGASEVLVTLPPGRYLMVCYMPAGKSRHLTMGMARELVVVPSPGGQDAPVHDDIRIVLTSYRFELSAPITAGRRVLRIENLVQEPHEVDIVRLLPGRSATDLDLWLSAPQGPPPFAAAGGSMVLDRGQVTWATIDFTPGLYALICFVPDTRDQRPHTAHGMVRVLTVD
ncbi:MAG: hypothetical protein U0133_10630 [Gemmatimonadales bacterium]